MVPVQQPWNIKSGTKRSLTKRFKILFIPFNHTFRSTGVSVHQRRPGGRWCSSWEPVVKLDSPAGVWSHQAVRCLSRNQSKSFPTQHSELETVRNTDAWLSMASLLRVTVTSSVYLTSNCGISQYTRLPVQSRLWHGNWTTFHKPCIYLGFLWLP